MVLTLDGPEPAPDVVSNTELGWAANLFPKSCGGRNRGLSLRIISPRPTRVRFHTTHSAPTPQPPGYDAHDPLLSLPPPHPTPSPAACSSLSSTTVTLCATSFLLVHWCGSAAVVGDHGDVQVFPTRHPIPSPTPPHSPHIPRPPSLPTTLPNRRTTVFTAVLCGLGWARWTGRHGAGCLGSVR